MLPPTFLRVVAAAVVVAVLAVDLPPARGQDAGGKLYRAVEACQKVAKKHLVLAENTISGAVRQTGDANATIEAYVRLWGERVSAGADGVPGAAARIRKCQDAFTASLDAILVTLEDRLRQSLEKQMLWYDEQMFGLFTDAISEATIDGVVQSVKFHLEPTLKIFDNQAVSGIKDAIKSMKPAYQTVSSCIRGQSLLADRFH
ncbi:hypothetical protein ONE63_008916 [Megalurothrips usitatus]|uniref:Uncharacterized protein n=1 Tax=Megalurothrips usitatus TaxID=439358 RepID=A0AAV7XQG6_9NEOP|nr:hypothetical protein ONE63_008916 [Megalurothrips usitatus]